MKRTSGSPHGWTVGSFGLTDLTSLTGIISKGPSNPVYFAHVVVVGLTPGSTSGSSSAAVVAVVASVVLREVVRDDEEEDVVATGSRRVFRIEEEEELLRPVATAPAPEVRMELQISLCSTVICREVDLHCFCDGNTESIGSSRDKKGVSIL